MSAKRPIRPRRKKTGKLPPGKSKTARKQERRRKRFQAHLEEDVERHARTWIEKAIRHTYRETPINDVTLVIEINAAYDLWSTQLPEMRDVPVFVIFGNLAQFLEERDCPEIAAEIRRGVEQGRAAYVANGGREWA